MKMKIGAELPPDYTPTQEDMAAASATLIAHALLPLFADNMAEPAARANAEAVTLELAYLMDEGEIVLGGKTYRPRLAFVDETGRAVDGFETLDRMAELSDTPFDLDPAAAITFQAPEYDA